MNPNPPPPPPVRADRAVGVVTASAAGDALGAGYEFGPPLPTDTPVEMAGGGTFGWQPGEWTDDTQMALAILTPLAAGDRDVGQVEAGFRDWYTSGPADVGIQTSAVLRSTGPLAEAAARFTENRPNGAAGNGSLMRTGPIALAHPRDPTAIATLARQVSALTHPDPDCTDACILWSVAIDNTIHCAPASDVPWNWTEAFEPGLELLPEDRRTLWRSRISEADGADPLAFPKNGWVVHAFQAALAAICSTPVPDGPAAGTHLRSALEHAVRAGGDTDTVAAITGALLGARWGTTVLPFAWRRLLHGHRVYGQPRLDAADIERLARLAYAGGPPQLAGWPAIDTMVPQYLQHWPDQPRHVSLGDVEFGNVHALQGALADGADTVISLCRMGTAEVPAGVEHHTLGLLDTTPEENPNVVLLLAEIVDGLQTMVDEGRHVFVHCVQAQNRTPAVAAAWLHRHRGVAAAAAIDQAGGALNRPKPFLAIAVAHLDEIPMPKTL